MVLKVGVSKIDIVIAGKPAKKILSVDMCPKDQDGYIDAKEYVPIPFELIILATDAGKSRTGWWTGHEFFCRKMPPNEHVVAWKKGCHCY